MTNNAVVVSEQEVLRDLHAWVDSITIEEALSSIKQRLERDFVHSFDIWFESLNEKDENNTEILRSSMKGLALGHLFELESQAWNLSMLGLVDKSIYENFHKKLLEHQRETSADAERLTS